MKIEIDTDARLINLQCDVLDTTYQVYVKNDETIDNSLFYERERILDELINNDTEERRDIIALLHKAIHFVVSGK